MAKAGYWYDQMASSKTSTPAVAPASKPAPSGYKSIGTLAHEVINGSWGNGNERYRRLLLMPYQQAPGLFLMMCSVGAHGAELGSIDVPTVSCSVFAVRSIAVPGGKHTLRRKGALLSIPLPALAAQPHSLPTATRNASIAPMPAT